MMKRISYVAAGLFCGLIPACHDGHREVVYVESPGVRPADEVIVAQPAPAVQAPVPQVESQVVAPTEPAVVGDTVVHESFFQPTVIERTVYVPTPPPPPPQEVIIYETRPGPEAVWVPGYWFFQASFGRYLWVCGGWRVPPPGMVWVPGQYVSQPGGYVWIPGHWQPVHAGPAVYIPQPPPPPRVEPINHHGRPGPDHVWIPGYWQWNGMSYVWAPARWVPARPGFVYVQPRYHRTPKGYVFAPGYFDRAAHDRGVPYRPMVVDRPKAGARIRPEQTMRIRVSGEDRDGGVADRSKAPAPSRSGVAPTPRTSAPPAGGQSPAGQRSGGPIERMPDRSTVKPAQPAQKTPTRTEPTRTERVPAKSGAKPAEPSQQSPTRSGSIPSRSAAPAERTTVGPGTKSISPAQPAPAAAKPVAPARPAPAPAKAAPAAPVTKSPAPAQPAGKTPVAKPSTPAQRSSASPTRTVAPVTSRPTSPRSSATSKPAAPTSRRATRQER